MPALETEEVDRAVVGLHRLDQALDVGLLGPTSVVKATPADLGRAGLGARRRRGRQQTTSLAPSAANRCASARPMPLAAPVTTTILPAIFMGFS